MDGLYFKTLAPSTSVLDACVGSITSAATKQLLIAKMNALEVWQMSGDSEGELVMVEEAVVHERIEHVRVLRPDAENLQSPAGTALDMLLVVTSDHAFQIIRWDPRSATFQALSTAQADAPEPPAGSPPALPRASGTLLSEQHDVERQGPTQRIFAAALYDGFLHVVCVEGGGQEPGPPRLAVQHMQTRALLDAAPGDWRKAHEAHVVRSLAFIPLAGGTDQEGNPLLVVLHQSTGFMDQAVHLQCLSVDLQHGALLTGPWTVRNVHPSTTLLTSFEPDVLGEPAGVVAFSSIGCQLYTPEAPGAMLTLEMAGTPRAVEKVFEGAWLMSDSAGVLWYLVLAGDTWHGQVVSVEPRLVDAAGAAGEEQGAARATITSVAEVLRALPCLPPSGRHIVFLGSHQGPSQVLLSPAPQQFDTAAKTALGCLAATWEMAMPAFVDNLGPINDVTMFEHPPGSGEKHLAMCCGGKPTGCLAISSVAAKRSALAEAGGLLPGFPTLHLGDMQLAGGGVQSHLALSFEAPEHTQVMALENGCLTGCDWQGLDSASSTLLFAAVPGGWAVQVTPKEIRVMARLPSCELHDSWEGPARLSLACSRGSHLLVAAGSKLCALIVEEETGKILLVQTADWERQLSAIAQVGVKLSGGREFRVSAVGTWEDNRVTLCRSGELSGPPLGCADLVHGQARSIAAAEFGGEETQLIVGTSAGLVMVFQISDAGSLSSAPVTVSLTPVLKAWAGSSSVQLSSLKHPKTGKEMLYASSSQDLLLREAEGGNGQKENHSRVCILRVNAQSTSASLVRLPAGNESHCTVAWADVKGRLLIGEIDPEALLRHRKCHLVDTPVAAAYHKESHCFMVVCTDNSDCATLRLIHADTLQQVSLLRMDPTHQPCSVAALPLPCSSTKKAKEDAFPASIDIEKEFFVVSSCLIQNKTRPGDGHGVQTAIGILSAFEVIHKPGEGFDHYEVVLHASQQISGIPLCIAGIKIPQACLPAISASSTQPADDQERPAESEPAVLVGTQDSVLLLRLFVDDLALWSIEAVQNVMEALEMSSAAPVLPPSSQGNGADHAAPLALAEQRNQGDSNGADEMDTDCAGGAPPPAPEDRWEVWRQRMRTEILSNCKSCTSGAIASMSTRSDSVLVHEFLGSAAVFKVGVDGSPSITRVAADNSPIYSPAGCHFGDNLFLFSMQPYGFLLLRQDITAQESFEALVRSHAEKIQEVGRRRQRAQAAAALQQNQSLPGMNPQEQLQDLPELSETPVLQPMGLCRKPQLVVKICAGRLGIPSSLEPGHSGHCEDIRNCILDSAVYVTSCGMIGSVQLISKAEIAVLERLQAAIHLASVSNNGEGAPWAATKHQHADMWNWSFSEMMAAGRNLADDDAMDLCGVESMPAPCVDGDLFHLFSSAGYKSSTFTARAKHMYEEATVAEQRGTNETESDNQVTWIEGLELALRIEKHSIDP